MKTQIHLLLLAASLFAVAVSPLRAQVVADGATNTLSNVTNTFTGDVTVGTNGSFTLLVLSDNALLTNSAHGVIGRNATAQSNEVQLLSASARWLMGGSLFVGSNGSFNRLVVSNGAFLKNNDSFIGIGAASSNNEVVVTGAGSFWTNRTHLYLGEFGSSGNRLVISHGAQVGNNSGLVGFAPSSTNNSVLVTGAGSIWSNRSSVSVGYSGNRNFLTISNGGGVFSSDGYVGLFTSSNNQVVVTGAGSLWSNQLSLSVGFNSSGNQLVVSNGGLVVANDNANVGFNVSSTDNRVTVDGGTLRTTNASATGLLEIRRGTNVLNAGLIEADILRLTNGPSGRIEINGGTLAIKSSRVSAGNPVIIGNGASPATLHLAGSGTHDFAGTLGLIVSSNATLSGNGSLLVQLLQVRPGATLSPGASIGRISINGGPGLQGTVIMELSKNGATLTNDQFQVTGTLTYGGTLTVTHLGPTALAAGDSFSLFSATAYAGAFASINLPPLPAPLFWKNNLLVNGSLEVAAPPAISLSAGTHTQNFDVLATNGTANPWRDNVTLPGWYAGKSVAPTNITTYRASNGGDNGGGLYSYGTTASTERALGALPANAVGTISYGLGFTNDTGASVSNFVLSYTGEQWRDSDAAITNTLTFWSRVGATALTNPEPGILTNWTAHTGLDFASPTVTGAGLGIIGNAATNRRVFVSVPVSGLTVPPGQCLFFRWHDVNDTGSDQGLGVDDLTVAFAATPPRITSIVFDATNGFPRLTGLGESNVTYGVEAATNLSPPILWQRLGNPVADGAGLFQFSDTNAPAFPRRFYRTLAP